MYKLAPSILAADFTQLGKEISEIEKAGADMLHVDVMDGRFVPSISFGMPVMHSIRPHTKLFMDVHLMIEEPERYIDEFVKEGADSITVHAEACRHLDYTIRKIKEHGVKAAVALNPATGIQILDYVLEELDMVLIMTVNPGFGGQKLLESSYRKIERLRSEVDRRKLSTAIQVDGGITLQNVGKVMEAGANVFVAGTSVFKGDKKENVAAYREVFSK